MSGWVASQRLISPSKPQTDDVVELGQKPCLGFIILVNILTSILVIHSILI
jgi:hypothetical protein